MNLNNKKLTIAYFYPDLLNLYGDNGNVEILCFRAKSRGIEVEVVNVSLNTSTADLSSKEVNFVFMGGGPDSSQKELYKDLTTNKGSYLKDYVAGGKTGLFICGAYQLMGRHYKDIDGEQLEGLGIFDLYTEHFGESKPRCIGNTVAGLGDKVLKDPVFAKVNMLDEKIVGFENHGGRTYLGTSAVPLGKIITGNGNNSEDLTEGIIYNNAIGTYFHGPFLARNPHVADYLIAKALDLDTVERLDDRFAVSAHTASLTLPR